MHTIRKEAIAAGAKFYFTGKPCIRGHIAKRYVTANGKCSECHRADVYAWRKSAPDVYRENYIRSSRKQRQKDPDKTRACVRRWYANNKGKAREIIRRWVEANPGKVAAIKAKYKAQKKSATPACANLKKIERIYELSAWASRFTDDPLHVDHIIPLQGELISGLHVHENLQIIPGPENCSKGNSFDGSLV